MKETKIYKSLPLKGTENGSLDFAIIEEPYGENSLAKEYKKSKQRRF
ncbi:hypothetical protein [Helicobacter sp. MIT 11-5569]|nr:hypothetical protein [Helicobacter sp. MIT 11-5569]